jgi:hypothetical protein
MVATSAIELLPPTEEDLDAAEAAWRHGTIRHDVAEGSIFWRVLRGPSCEKVLEYAAVCHPSGGISRFSPVILDNGIVPSAYAGDRKGVALWEVPLRDIRHGGLRRIPTRHVKDRYLVQTRTKRGLRLLDLRRPTIASIVAPTKRPPDLSPAWPAAYDITREWTQRLYERMPFVDGFIYESHQVQGNCILLLQRADPEVFTTTGKANPLNEEPVRSILRSEARKAGAVVDFGDDPE